MKGLQVPVESQVIEMDYESLLELQYTTGSLYLFQDCLPVNLLLPVVDREVPRYLCNVNIQRLS